MKSSHPSRRARLGALGICATLSVSATSAQAQPVDEKQVTNLYTVAKNAFDSGRFGEALRALEECYRLTKDIKYLWRVGVTAEKSYWAAQKEEDLKKAVEAYRGYLEQGGESQKRVAASQALKKLEPLLPKQAPVDSSNPQPAAPAQPPAPAAARTGVMISSSTPGARIELDGKQRAAGFLVADVSPGPHKVIVAADGYITVERQIPVQPGALVGIDIPLEPKPATVAITGPSGAELFVDGEPKGELPLSKPLALAPGDRLISVQQPGSEPMSVWKSVERGGNYTVDADLQTTGQRHAAWITFTATGAAAITAAALTGLAVRSQQEADDLIGPVNDGNGGIDETDLEEFDRAVADRDKLRTGAGVAWGLTGAGLAAGVFLYVFDRPTVQAPPAPNRTKPGAAPPATKPPDDVELTVVPLISPDVAGLTVGGRF